MKCEEKWTEKIELKTVILPTGSMEAHGAHLPFATDSIIPERIAQEAAKRTNAFLLPTLPYGNTQRLSNFKGTISLTAQGLVYVIKDILKSVIKQGAGKVIILNGHDGNQHSLQVATRDVLEESEKNVKIMVVDAWWNIIPEKVLKELNITREFGHAGKEETSVMMYIASESVDVEKAIEQKFVEEHQLTKYYFNDRKIPCEGNPTDASKELGKKIFDAVVDSLVELISKS